MTAAVRKSRLRLSPAETGRVSLHLGETQSPLRLALGESEQAKMIFGWRELPLRCIASVFLGSLVLATPAGAQRADSLAELVREVAERSVERAPSGSGSDRLNIRRRQDLENLLLNLEPKKSVQDVYFYEIQSPPGKLSEAPVLWVVAVGRFGPDVYKLYNFRGSAEPDAPSQEFNRFTSQLTLSIAEEKATGLARLFLKCCVVGDGQEIVLDDEIQLRLAVQNYYFATYRDLWIALDAYSRWWKGFHAHAPVVPPTVAIDSKGRYRVALNRLVTAVGKHPQVQQWQLEVSREGGVRVLSKQLVFPELPGWLFYDEPSALRNPPFSDSPQ